MRKGFIAGERRIFGVCSDKLWDRFVELRGWRDNGWRSFCFWDSCDAGAPLLRRYQMTWAALAGGA